MGVLGKTRSILGLSIEWLYCLGQEYGEKKKIKDTRRKKLLDAVDLNDRQEKQIDDLFIANYGRKIPYDWHRLYQSYTGKFSEKYFPEILFSSKVEPKMNPMMYRHVLDDKILLPLFCNNIKNVRTPKTIATFSNGVYFDAENTIYSEKKMLEYLLNCGEIIIKPVQNTSSGRGVKKFKIREGIDQKSRQELRNIIKEYCKDSFIIQEVVEPHELLKKIYPSAINTFRIVTYIWNGNIYHWPVILRIGQGGSYLDNAHAGGMFISVSDSGVLGENAYTEFQKVYFEHPDTHIKFADYKFPFVPELIDAAKRMHLNAPQLGVISWDLTMDSQNEVVLIEVNTIGQAVWVTQMASGIPAFGDNTEEILKFISRKN